VSSFSAANARWPRIGHGWRPTICVGWRRPGTTLWSRAKACRLGIGSRSCAISSLGLLCATLDWPNWAVYRSGLRCRTSRSASMQSYATLATWITCRRPSSSLAASLITSRWTWPCARLRTCQRRCTWPARSSCVPTRCSPCSLRRRPGHLGLHSSGSSSRSQPCPVRRSQEQPRRRGAPRQPAALPSPHAGGAARTTPPRLMLQLRRAFCSRPPVQAGPVP
jgi:hypothetical protein